VLGGKGPWKGRKLGISIWNKSGIWGPTSHGGERGLPARKPRCRKLGNSRIAETWIWILGPSASTLCGPTEGARKLENSESDVLHVHWASLSSYLPVNLTKSSSKLGCRLIDCCQPSSLHKVLANCSRIAYPAPARRRPFRGLMHALLSTSDRRSSPARPEIRTRISHPTPDTSEEIRGTQRRHEALRERFRGRCERAVNGLRGQCPCELPRALSCRPSTPRQARAIKRPSRALSPATHRLLLIGILNDEPRRRLLQVREPLLSQIDG
jgi:hypothetical protein